jgi:sucrose phosphorylase
MTNNTPGSPEETKSNPSEFHFLEPDYNRDIFEIPPEFKEKIQERLTFLYGEQKAHVCFKELERIMRVYYAYKTPHMIQMEETLNAHERFTEEDVILITYGDLIQGKDRKPLEILADFTKYLKGAINTLHILPFFPYSSDRGFSVTDFEEVDPRLGTWDDILNLKSSTKLIVKKK